jgi:hypothetical protein
VRLLRRAERRRRLLRRAEPTESTERHRDRASRRADARVAISRARRKSHASAPRACDLLITHVGAPRVDARRRSGVFVYERRDGDVGDRARAIAIDRASSIDRGRAR